MVDCAEAGCTWIIRREGGVVDSVDRGLIWTGLENGAVKASTSHAKEYALDAPS